MATQTGSIDLKGMTSAYSDQQQYFWVESSSSATWGGGAHITNIAESAFKTAAGTWGTDPTAGGYNLLMNTDTANATGSLQLRNGSLPIMNLDNDSLDFNTIDITGGTYRTVASFGETTQIGYDDETKMILSSNSFDMVDSNGTSISHIGNPTNQLLLDVFFYDSTEEDPNIFVLTESPTTIEEVTINDVATTNYTLHDLDQITINSTLTDGDKISITYKFAGETVYYTFGYRKDGGGTEEDDYFTVGQYSFAAGCYLSATGTASHAEGYNTEAKGHSSHAEGHETIAWQDYAHAEGNGCQAEGEASHAEGAETPASGVASHAEGGGTQASGQSSHAEGILTIASGQSSHAEGYMTEASGNQSHTEGFETIASGVEAHAEGWGTIAAKGAQHVIGSFNIEDNGASIHPSGNSIYGTYALIIGNGTSDTARSNAFTVDWDGNLEAAEYYTKPRTLNLGVCACGAVLTTDASALYFTIPTGRVFPSGTTITRITGNMSVRASNRNSTGMYIVKSSSGGSSGAAFDTAASVVSTFYDGANNKRTPSVKPSLKLYGGTNIHFAWATGIDNYFSGNATNTSYVNNQACMVMLTNLVVYLS